ncbi:MAG: tetratricopeptide repeat protein [Bryobacterales bacterium]|nr:tetratricopeptide repeat protein [Bryobacterales bacterium]
MTRRIALLSVAGTLVLAVSGPGEDDWREGVRNFSAEDFRQAQEAFERAVEQDPESSTFSLWLALAMGRRAERMTGLRKLAAAPLVRRMRRELERSIELDETNLYAYDALQGFHLGAPALVGGSKAEAREIAIRMYAIDAVRGAEALGTYHEAMGELAAAAEQFDEARRLDPDGMRPLLKQAAFLARRGKHEESDEPFDLAFSRDPDEPKVWRVAATARIHAKRKSRYPEARKLVERSLVTPDREPNRDPRSEVRDLLKKL